MKLLAVILVLFSLSSQADTTLDQAAESAQRQVERSSAASAREQRALTDANEQIRLETPTVDRYNRRQTQTVCTRSGGSVTCSTY